MQSPGGGRGGRTRLASIGGIESKLFHVKHRESPEPRQWPTKCWNGISELCARMRWSNHMRESSSTIAAAFSAIIRVGALVFPEVMVGITEASATRNPATP